MCGHMTNHFSFFLKHVLKPKTWLKQFVYINDWNANDILLFANLQTFTQLRDLPLICCVLKQMEDE